MSLDNCYACTTLLVVQRQLVWLTVPLSAATVQIFLFLTIRNSNNRLKKLATCMQKKKTCCLAITTADLLVILI